MKLLINKYKVKEIQFMDDNMIIKREHIENICNLIIKEKLNITWSSPNGIRADCLDEEIALLMRKAGCYLVTIGIESANPTVLKTIKKGESIEQITKAIKCAKKAGLTINGAFVLGLPGDTRETMRETIDYAKKCHWIEHSSHLWMLFPVVKFGKKINKNIAIFREHHLMRNHL